MKLQELIVILSDMKKAYVFPGQGSQFPGMAKDLYEGGAKGKELLDRADEVLDSRLLI